MMAPESQLSSTTPTMVPSTRPENTSLPPASSTMRDTARP